VNCVRITIDLQKPQPLLQKHKSPSTQRHNKSRQQDWLQGRRAHTGLSYQPHPTSPHTVSPTVQAGNPNQPVATRSNASGHPAQPTSSSLVVPEIKLVVPSPQPSSSTVSVVPEVKVDLPSQSSVTSTTSNPSSMAKDDGMMDVVSLKRRRSKSQTLPSSMPAFKLHPQNAPLLNTNPTTIPIIFNPILQSDAQRNYFVFTSPTDHRYHSSFDVFPPHLWNVPGIVDFGVEEYVTTWPPSIQSELRQFLGAAASLVKTRIKLPPNST